jgi:hypothetical protein
MDPIDAQELKAKLDRGDDFKFVMTLGEWEYRTTHIPGSMRISTIEKALEELTEVRCPSGRMRGR